MQGPVKLIPYYCARRQFKLIPKVGIHLLIVVKSKNGLHLHIMHMFRHSGNYTSANHSPFQRIGPGGTVTE